MWRHKNEISEIMGFVRIFWKNNAQEAYLPKMKKFHFYDVIALVLYTTSAQLKSLYFVYYIIYKYISTDFVDNPADQ